MAGRDIKVNMINGVLPDVSSTLTGWEIDMYAIYVKQEMIDGEIINQDIKQKIIGTLQPLKAEEVNLKPEGQRAWQWYDIHVKSSYPILRVEQKIKVGDIEYKIMAVKDYTLYGYVEYHVVRNYE